MARSDLGLTVFHILIALAGQDRHGYAIMQDVAARTNGRIKLSPGTLYGAIRRLLEEGLIVELNDRPDPEYDNERRRYYRLTDAGYAAARAEAARMKSVLGQARASGLLPGDVA
ncbi:MAG TPA: PadR family transcriptional regulator [Bryobacteraceae bacterium]|nr:PadR family transcriptional regulator [Bryobacteraceae bacterium]